MGLSSYELQREANIAKNKYVDYHRSLGSRMNSCTENSYKLSVLMYRYSLLNQFPNQLPRRGNFLPSIPLPRVKVKILRINQLALRRMILWVFAEALAVGL